MTDVEKLIEELPWLLGKYTNGSYWMRDAECDSIRNTILSALRRLAAAEKVVEAVRGLSFGEDWNNGTHAKIYRPQIRPALSAYDAAKEPQ